MPKPQPATRIRTCRSCGTKFEYPLKGSDATRFHCEHCVTLDPKSRKIMERLNLRIRELERTVEKLKG